MSRAVWMMYGASGDTGTLIAEEAIRRGHLPLLVGCSPRVAQRDVPIEYICRPIRKGTCHECVTSGRARPARSVS